MIRQLALTGLVAAIVSVPAVTAFAAPPAGTSTTLTAGHELSAGRSLRSTDGGYVLTMQPDGVARLTAGPRTLWRTPSGAPGAALALRRNGDLVLENHGRTVWQSATRGASDRLSVGRGAVTVSGAGGVVWSSSHGNGCGSAAARHEVIVDISRQRAWFCSRRDQVLTTPVTTGATKRGDGTPTGTWHVYAKTRDTTLFPAAGGAFHVHFWMPYDGAYGLHDAPWQHFAYGSSRYRTRGSHGCVHVPEAAMRYLFRWAPVGTTVTIHR